MLKSLETSHIIVRMPNWIGDLVMATPILYDLKKAFPSSQVTAMCKASLAPLIEKDPSVNELFRFSPSENFLRRIQEKNLVSQLRKGRYDLGILATNSFSSAWRLFQGKVQTIVGFKGDGRGWMLKKALPFPEKRQAQHLVLTYKRLLLPLGIPISSTAPRLYLNEDEIDAAWMFLKRFSVDRSHKIIGINPGAAFGQAKCWLPDRFREVIKRLSAKCPSHRILVFGDLGHKKLIQTICSGLSSQVINLSGQTDLRELMALIALCSVFLTNDSGPMHIADSLNVPLVALFGSTDPIVTGPYSRNIGVIQEKVACAPCFKRICPIDFLCMKKISVEQVCKSLFQILDMQTSQLSLRERS